MLTKLTFKITAQPDNSFYCLKGENKAGIITDPLMVSPIPTQTKEAYLPVFYLSWYQWCPQYDKASNPQEHTKWTKWALLFINYLQSLNSMVTLKTGQGRKGWVLKQQIRVFMFLWGAQNLMVKETWVLTTDWAKTNDTVFYFPTKIRSLN